MRAVTISWLLFPIHASASPLPPRRLPLMLDVPAMSSLALPYFTVMALYPDHVAALAASRGWYALILHLPVWLIFTLAV